MWPASSFNTYLSPCFVTVPEKVWLSPAPAALDAEPVADDDPEALGSCDPDCGIRLLGVVVSGVLCDGEAGAVESGLCDEGDCADGVLSGDEGVEGDGVGEVCGVCCEGVVSGDDDGCCACWFGAVDGVVSCAWSALPQEIIPMAIARVARNDSV